MREGAGVGDYFWDYRASWSGGTPNPFSVDLYTSFSMKRQKGQSANLLNLFFIPFIKRQHTSSASSLWK